MKGDFDAMAVVVTGAGSGIGAAISAELLRRGALVAAVDLDPSTAPPGALHVMADVTDDGQVRAAIGEVVDHFDVIDVLVNCAGIGAIGTVADNADAEWLHVFDVNVLGTVRTTRAALEHLRRSRAASIVNVGSIAATAGLPRRAVYSASKGALHALTRAMAADHLAEGIRVNCVAPGTADTPWIRRLLAQADDPEAELATLCARQPHGRLVGADEVAGAVAYLASPRSGSTTGTILAVDGGMYDLRLQPRTQE